MSVSPSQQPWNKCLEAVSLLHTDSLSNSRRSTPIPDEERHMHLSSTSHLSRSASESQIIPSSSIPPPPPIIFSNVLPPDNMSLSPPTPPPNFLRHPRSAPLSSSPLNPSSPPTSLSPFTPTGSRPRTQITRIPSEESRALSMALPSSPNTTRGSMILYRRADTQDTLLLPPAFPTRDSVLSTSGDSFVSLSADSKYPAGLLATERGLVAYAYDPDQEDQSDDDLEEKMFSSSASGQGVSWRGLRNLAMLLALLAGLLSLFVVYPVFSFFHDNGRNLLIVENTVINSTGQAVDLINFSSRSQIPILFGGVDEATPHDVRVRTVSGGEQFVVIFSDEFDVDGRSFHKGDDPIWEVVNQTLNDNQIYTQNGYLFINPPSTTTLRLRTPLCLDNGFVEVGLVSTEGWVQKRKRKQIHWSGVWSLADERGVQVPGGSSLKEVLWVEVFIGVVVDGMRYSGSAPGDVLVDYVRVYQRKTRTPSSCGDVPPAQRVSSFLDILQPLSDFTPT